MYFFFFQAEDGIRDADVTGVQTCALPIFTELVSKINDGSITRITSIGNTVEGELEDGSKFSGFLPEEARLTFYPDYVKEDRKSTRLNSSHVRISYAVFCLKKKTTKRASVE